MLSDDYYITRPWRAGCFYDSRFLHLCYLCIDDFQVCLRVASQTLPERLSIPCINMMHNERGATQIEFIL